MKTLTHEEKFRGEDLLKKMAACPIVMCGCGAIGSNLVDNMVRQGFGNIKVVDFDRIEDHNRHTQIWTKRDLGQLKAMVLKNAMYNVREVVLEVETKKLDSSNISKVLPPALSKTLVIDGFDNQDSRALVMDWCLRHKIDCLHVGLSKDYAEVVWNEQYRVPRDVGADICEYPLARNIILLATTVATEVVVRYLAKGIKKNYEISLGDFQILERI